jgi:hypothetical protein
LLTLQLDTSAKVAVVDPIQDLPNLPFLSKAEHLRQGFGVQKMKTILEQGELNSFEPKNLDSWLQ